VAIPPNRPCIRIDRPDLVFGSIQEKFEAISKEVEERHHKGQPVLIGTASIETSELISNLLNARKIPHSVLNAKQHEREAYVVAQAGAEGSVTVATNMAGRGTDIVLGGNPEVLIRSQMDGEEEAKIQAALKERKTEFEKAHNRVLALGGLYVLGTERHDARRIDNQLRGRSGRQGDPGESRFYLSLEDDLMRRFAPPWARSFMQRNGLSNGEPLEHSLITKSIGNAQKKVEEFNFDIRKNLLEYDEVMNEQRKFIYAVRNRILREENVKNLLDKWVKDAIQARVEQFFNNAKINDEPQKVEEAFRDWVRTSFLTPMETNESLIEVPAGELFERIHTIFQKIYTRKEEALGDKLCRMMERYLLLQTIDHHWKDHLYAMDHVKDSIGWRGYAQVDPKVEYKREGFSMFGDMLYAMKLQVTEIAVRMQVVVPETDLAMESVFQEGAARHEEAGSVVHGDRPPEPLGDSAVQENRQENRQEDIPVTAPIVNQEVAVKRNDPCPCGSNKKYKACCGKK